MPSPLSRRLRLISFGLVLAGAVVASGLAFRVPTFGLEPRDRSASFGIAVAQLQLLEEGMKRATAGIGQTSPVVLEDIRLDLGHATYRMPKIEFFGVNLSRAELMVLFQGTSAVSAAPGLAKLSAKEVRIPEIRVEQTFGEAKQITVYRDVVGRDMMNGRIASLTSAAATLDVAGPHPAKGSSGQLTISDIDLAYAVALYGQKAGPQQAPTKTVYAAFSLDNLQIGDGKGAELRIARMAGNDFRARPTVESWSEAMRIMGEAQDLEKASPAERSRVFSVLVDLFDAYEIGSLEATGFEVRDVKGKDPSTGRIARLAFTGGSPNQVADARAEGIEIVSSNGRARIATIAFTGFSFKETLQGLKNLGEKAFEKLDAADLRRLVPTVGTMRFSGLDFDVPNERSKAPKPENIRFGVKDIEVTADKPVNGIPTNLRMAVENATFAISANTKEEGLTDLAALGYSKLDLSFVTAIGWNEPGSELVVREVSVRGADMGSAVLRGVVANVGKDVFNPDSAVALVALIGATARNVDLTIENNGLFERLIAQEAKKQKKTPEDLRREYGMAAAVAVPAMLGNSAAAKTLGQAVARFVAKPGRLNISARTKDPAGLGFADFAAAADPAALLDKLEISATAE